jgi:gliding motility-associated-like protein
VKKNKAAIILRVTLIIFLSFIFQSVYAQEICDNGIDDDGDGLIDLNDEECFCEGFVTTFDGIIPNPSFEDTLCCPHMESLVFCCEDWQQASWVGTSDYYNECDFTTFVGGDFVPAGPDIPDGEGWMGLVMNSTYKEYIGTCLDAPFIAGTEYTMKLHMNWVGFPMDYFELALYGSPDCDDIYYPGAGCPIGEGSWEMMVMEPITFDEKGEWIEVTVTFTPTVDMNALIIGGSCSDIIYCYVAIDHLQLFDGEVNSEIIESGNWCDGDLALEAAIDTVGGTLQWYKDGIALVGETDDVLDVMLYGEGLYSAVYTLDGTCHQLDHMINLDSDLVLSFDAVNVCLGESVEFTNTSTFPDDYDPDWSWDFGDGTTSDEESPTHVYTEPGEYTVTLVGEEEGEACPDTTVVITVYPIPTAAIEFIVNGVSSQDGATGGCILNPIQFNDLSTIETGEIVAWEWDFGDGSTSTDENPEHEYAAEGTYTVLLTVTSEFGCEHTTSIEIEMTLGLAVDIVLNEPSCYGFTDGSLTIMTEDILDEVTYEIKDSAGAVLNIDNSNTANNLSEGWYYFLVDDGSGCVTNDSVYISQPAELDIELTVTDPQCYGEATGWASVQDVYNYGGSYDEITYVWNPNPAGVGGLFADSSYNLVAGDYTLTINDANGCAKTFDFEITQPDSLYFSQFGYEPAYCRLFEYQSGNGVVFGAAAGGTPDFDYLWTHLESGETSNNSTWGGLNPGNYTLQVTDQKGCLLVQSVYLDSLNPIADFTVVSDDLNGDLQGTAPVEASFMNTSENFANPNNPLADTTFYWNLNNPLADWQISKDYDEQIDTIYDATGTSYFVEVCLVAMNKNGCTDTACQIITIYEPILFEPVNVFTPDDDGVNDFFTFNERAASIATFECVIVNRWGTVVHEIKDIADVWDGNTKDGKPCPAGVYFYSYRLTTDNGTNLQGQGHVTLIRD